MDRAGLLRAPGDTRLRGGAPDAIKVIIGALWVIWYVAFFAWLIVDVRYFEEEWYWIPIGWACCGYPIVFIIYWFRTR